MVDQTGRTPEAQQLEAFARTMFPKMQEYVRKNEEVMPCIITLGPKGLSLYGLAGENSDVQRAALQKACIARDEAVGSMLVSDAWLKNTAGERIGEALQAIIETPFETFVISQRYTRDPLVFQEIEVWDNGPTSGVIRAHGSMFRQVQH